MICNLEQYTTCCDKQSPPAAASPLSGTVASPYRSKKRDFYDPSTHPLPTAMRLEKNVQGREGSKEQSSRFAGPPGAPTSPSICRIRRVASYPSIPGIDRSVGAVVVVVMVVVVVAEVESGCGNGDNGGSRRREWGQAVV
jgi:hypothetical protein